MYRLGVGAIIIKPQNGIFVGKRIDFQNYQMPQGGIDDGEDCESALIREVREETGLQNIRIIGNNKKWYFYNFPNEILMRNSQLGLEFIGQKQRWFVLEFLGSDDEIDLQSTEHHEFSHWKWSDTETLINEIVSFKKNLYTELFFDYSDTIKSFVGK